MKMKLPDGNIYDEQGRKCTILKDFLEANPDVIYFKYPYLNFEIYCKKIFVSENNCLVKTNGHEELLSLDNCELYQEVENG